MDVYRNFRKHFPSHSIGTPKKRQQDVKPERTKVEPASPSSSKSKAKQSSSDVQLGLQKLVLSVPDASGTREHHLIRLFVIPSTSGLAAGYTVGQSNWMRRTHWADESSLSLQDADRVALLVELKTLISRLDTPITEDDGTIVLKA
jgi:hypothetical protein